MTVALLRMLPVSNLVVSFALALGRVDSRTFLLGSLIGYLPQGVVAVFVGSGLSLGLPWIGSTEFALAIGGLLALSIWTSRVIGKRFALGTGEQQRRVLQKH